MLNFKVYFYHETFAETEFKICKVIPSENTQCGLKSKNVNRFLINTCFTQWI